MGLWPDRLIRELLLGELELRQGRTAAAEQRFRRLIQREPLIAAFHQGRGLALLAEKHELEALEEFIAVTGAVLPNWLMPGGPWQSKGENSLFVPPVDRLIFRQALAVPITEDTLLCDASAITGADLLYIQTAAGQFVRAEVARVDMVRPAATSPTSKPTAACPLVAIRVRRARFTPVELDKPAPLPPGFKVIIRSADAFRQMGQEIRTRPTSVATGGQDPTFSPGLLPGESTGAVFADGKLVGFLSGRISPADEGGGKSHFYGAEDLALLVESARKQSRPLAATPWQARLVSSGASGEALDSQPSTQQASDGTGFLLMAIIGERL